MRRTEIVLIGPVGVGKTTVATLVAARLGKPRVSMDDRLFSYMAEVGFDEGHWKRIIETQGRSGGYRYLRVFGAHAVERLLEDHRDCVFDFGGGGTMGEFPDEFARIRAALAPFANVVLLIPSLDRDASLRFLYDRLRIDPPGWTILEHLVRHPSNYELARHVVLVEGKTPERICDEVVDLARGA